MNNLNQEVGSFSPLMLLLLVLTLVWLAWVYGRPASQEALRAEVVIAVMGVTGSGKSTFIRTMTDNQAVHVGHGLESDTSEVSCYRFTEGSTEFVLVDTPGFNDTNFSDEKIMTCVLEWLETSFRSGMRLNGLIYLHRIIDPKMQGSALSNMRMFRKLCGPDCFENIVLATTFWDDVSTTLGDKRELQLKENNDFWGAMVKKGSKVVRLGTSRESGLKVLMEIAKKNKITLQSQHEMVTENRSAHETTAAQTINEDLSRQKVEFEQRLKEQRLLMEEQLQQQKLEKQRALARARAHAQKQERKRLAEEGRRKVREEAEWRAEHERRQRELQEAKERMEEQRRREQALERQRQEALERQRRAEQELKAERKRYYDHYVCQRVNVGTMGCDSCYKSISSEFYWHCCHCLGDNFDACNSCGGGGFSCRDQQHPQMDRRWKSAPKDDCAVM